MATLHFICGKAWAGKTTLARELGRGVPAIVFCEDEWIDTLGFAVRSLDDFREAAAKCRKLIGPLATELLRLGVSVVFDLRATRQPAGGGCAACSRRSGADHLLHVIEASDAECLANIRRRNDEKPPGIYWGHFGEETFHAVTAYFVPPRPEEGFRIETHKRR